MSSTTPAPWYHVDKQLLPVKGIYFTFLAAIGDLLPFIVPFMKQLGLSSTETGVIYGVMPFISFFSRPLFGALADKTRRHKLFLVLCVVLTGLCYCLLLLTPAKTKQEMGQYTYIQTDIQCGQLDSFIKDCEPTPTNDTNIADTTSADNDVCSRSLKSFSKELTANASNINCSAKCVLNFVPLNLHYCFTNETSPLNSNSCPTRVNSTMSSSGLEFTIDDLAAVIDNKVEGQVSTYNGQTCQNYDLKNVTYNGDKYWQFTCSADAVLECHVTCDHDNHAVCNTSTVKLSRTFWVFFFIFLFCNIFFTPVLSLIDAMAYDILGKKGGHWGKQRLWGTIGFAVFAVTSTFIMDEFYKQNKTVDYTASFCIFLGLCLISAVITCFLDFSESMKCKQMFKNITSLFRYPEIVVFIVVITCFGMMNAVTEAFLFWFLIDLGSPSKLLGLCLVFNCLPEIFILQFAGKIIKTIGHIRCLYIALFAYVIRFAGYSFLVNPWYVLFIEPLHSACFALMYAAGSLYASKITPEGMSATVQGLVGGFYFNFGKGIGSLVTGKMFDPVSGLGPRWTFRVYAGFALVVLIVYAIVQNVFFSKPMLPESVKEVNGENKQSEEDGDETMAGDMLLGANTVSNENTEL